MKKMKGEQQEQLFSSIKIPNNPQRYLHNFMICFLFFGSGLVIGITLSFYLNDLPFIFNLKFQEKEYSVGVKPPSPILSSSKESQLLTPPTISRNSHQSSSPPPPLLPKTTQQSNFDSEEKLPIEQNLVLESNPVEIKQESGERVGLKEFLEPPKAMHDMTDEELSWRASFLPTILNYPFKQTPKVAFMYLSRGDMPLAPLWERFFAGHEGLYSIYVHTQPFYNGNAPPNSVFHNRRIPSKAVEWGKFSMIEAERRLLANALLDISNTRFVLLSEACIPLYNFTTIYKYLMESNTTFVESYDDPSTVGRGRYSRRMMPHVSINQWRKGSQWIEVDRQVAVDIITDTKYFNLFKKYCRPDCYSDEHYIPTMVTMKFWRKNANRTLTWVDWSKGGPHPMRFGRYEVTVDLLKDLRKGGKCLYNGKSTDVCHLFARKFSYLSLNRLLMFSQKAFQY
ncbi:hypothetical protein Leryth_005769 [Lithospermum erythrorhizon]|nr:hypothetical protein Leryth_005769 [Lithospermum erythrorhizon]